MKTYALILFLACTHTLHADIPFIITFQGFLTHAQSFPAYDTLEIDFSLYAYSECDIPLWSEHHSTSLLNGIFQVNLGEKVPLELDFSQQLWLGMSLDGQEILPRMKIGVVPKAVHALVADSLKGGVNGVLKSINGLTDSVTIVGESPLIVKTSKDSLYLSLDFSQIQIHTDSILSITSKDDHINISIKPLSIGSAELKDQSVSAEKLQSGVIPVSLPPEGVAGGDLTGEYPHPLIKSGAIQIHHLSDELKKQIHHQCTSSLTDTHLTTMQYDHFAIHKQHVGDMNTMIVQSNIQEAAKIKSGPCDTLLYFRESKHATAPNTPINAHVFSPKSNEYDIDLVLSPKGIGSILGNLPDNTSTGGVKRGIHAIDFQLSRSANHQVASGNYSGLFAGMNNVSFGNNATVLGGISNNAEGNGSAIIGGYNNQASGTYAVSGAGAGNSAVGLATIALGISNTAGVESSASIGGKNNYAGAMHSVVLGGSFTHVTGSSGCSLAAQQSNAIGNQTILLGGKNNTATGSQSIIMGGAGLTLSHAAINSIGTLANNVGLNRNMTISAPNTFILGNMDIWLASNDNLARGIYFFEPGSSTGNYPGGNHHTVIRAGAQDQHIAYTLPKHSPESASQVLTASPGGQMTWGHSLVMQKNIYVDCPPIAPAGGTSFCDIKLSGVQPGAVVHITTKNNLPGGTCIAFTRVLQANLIRIAFMNATGGLIDPPPIIADLAIIQ